MLKFLKSSHVDPKPGYDNAHYYTMQITASQFLDKLCDTSASVTINYISQTVQASINWIGLSSVLRPRQHSIGYMGDGFYRSKDPTILLSLYYTIYILYTIFIYLLTYLLTYYFRFWSYYLYYPAT